jgi:hypothetical protein
MAVVKSFITLAPGHAVATKTYFTKAECSCFLVKGSGSLNDVSIYASCICFRWFVSSPPTFHFNRNFSFFSHATSDFCGIHRSREPKTCLGRVFNNKLSCFD